MSNKVTYQNITYDVDEGVTLENLLQDPKFVELHQSNLDKLNPKKIDPEPKTDNFYGEEGLRQSRSNKLLQLAKEKLTEPYGISAFLRNTASATKDVGIDLARVVVDTAENFDPISLGLQAQEMKAGLQEKLGFEPKKPPSFYETLDKINKESRRAAIPNFVKKAIFEEGFAAPVKAPDTLIGTAASIVPYIAGGTKIYKSMGEGVNKYIRGAVAAGGTDVALADREDEDIFGMLKDSLPEGVFQDFVSFLAVDEEDPLIIEKFKVLGQGASLGFIIDLAGGATKLGSYLYDKKIVKPFQELTSEEKGNAVVDLLRQAKETIGLRKRDDLVEYTETPEGVAQVMAQESSIIKRFTQRFTKARGYLTPKAFNAFNDSKYAQRQTITEAEHIAGRLQTQLDDLTNDLTKTDIMMSVTPKGRKKFKRSLTEKEETLENVNIALTDDGLFKTLRGKSQEEKVFSLVEVHNLPREIAETVVEAREAIDQLSKKLVGSSEVPDSLKEIIVENSGKYLRRSFRLFEDAGYAPTAEIIKEADNYFINILRRRKANKNDTFEELQKKAEIEREKILNIGKNPDELYMYLNGTRRINREILKGRKDIPAPIRALMGEIKNPSENILLTMTKMTQLLETSRFYENMRKLGTSGGYIRKKASGVFTKEITGTNSNLDGLYTTPEIFDELANKTASFAKGREGLLPNIIKSKGYQNFLRLKGTSQKMATVYNHVTHLRNFSGAAQFAPANGVNPFTTAKETWNMLNKVALKKTGDKELEKLYRKYQRLGIINTNVKVSEFKKLLGSPYEANLDEFIFKTKDKLRNYGLSGRSVDYADNLYVATDDLFKINYFNAELKLAKEAMPEASDDVLEEYAAEIVRNTIPNYDRVPPGLRALRELPIGSYFSFPAETLRVSANTFLQAVKEINSANPLIKKRGMKRAAGFIATQSALPTLATASYKLQGFNEREQKAIEKLSETPWSKNSPKILFSGGDNLYTLDTQYIDSFSYVKEPFSFLLRKAMDNQLTNKEATEQALDIGMGVASLILGPYVDETILSNAIGEVGFALISPNGRTQEGKPIFTEPASAGEKLGNIVFHVGETLVPGALKNLHGLYKAGAEIPNSFGSTKSPYGELVANTTGFRFKKINPDEVLSYAVQDYKFRRRNMSYPTLNKTNTPSDIESDYKGRQRELYNHTSDLYQVIDAYKVANGEDSLATRKLLKVLKDKGLSREEISYLNRGQFLPENTPLNTFEQRIKSSQVTPFGSDDNVLDLSRRLHSIHLNYRGAPLVKPKDQFEEESEKSLSDFAERAGFNIGGEVSTVIPNAPIEPDERVNKLTGLPYNETAGTAYMDFDDPLRPLSMSKGGKVLRALKRKQA